MAAARRRGGADVRLLGPAAFAGLAPFCAFAGPAAAATPPPTRDLVLQLRPDQPVAIPEYGDARCALRPLGAEDAAASGEALQGVAISGEAAIAPERLSREWAGLIGRPVDAPVAARLAERVACVYHEAGYLFADAKMIPGDVPGHWRLEVSEGRVAGVVVRGGTPAARAFVERAFAPVRVGEPLRLAALRRGLAVVRDFGMWGVRPSAEPAPGGAPGTVVLALDVDTPKPSVFVSVQNLSAPTVGPWSASTSLSLHGLTPFYDHTTIGLFHGLSSNRQQGAALSTDLLLTRGGLSLHGDLSWFRERPDETPPNRDTVGTTRLARVELSRPVLARADTLAVVRAGVEAVNQDVDLTTGAATERDRLRVVYAGVRVDARRGQTSGWGRLTVRKGIEGLGASRPGDPLLSRPAADPQATAVRFDASARRPLGGGAVELRARTQWADRPLLGFEEFTYGGFYGGRGLDPGALQGDRGLALTAEWRGKGRPLPGKWTIAPVAFVDYARAWNEDAYGPARGEALFGGGGARLSWNEQINLELVYAHPLGEPSGVAPDLAGPRLLLTLTAGFDINW